MCGIIKEQCPLNKLIHAIKRIMLGRYEKYFISIITCSSSLITASNKLRTYCKFKYTLKTIYHPMWIDLLSLNYKTPHIKSA